MIYSHDSKPLLILPCSADKLPGRQLAHDKYTGKGYWGLIRTLGLETVMLACDLIIISAEHGVLRGSDLVDDYDRMLTSDRLEDLKRDPRQANRFRKAIPDAEQPVYLACPSRYRALVMAWGGNKLLKRTVHAFPSGAGIGAQRQLLKRWVSDILDAYRKGIQRQSFEYFLHLHRDSDTGALPPRSELRVGDMAFYMNDNWELAGPRRILSITEPANGVHAIQLEGLSAPVSGTSIDAGQRNMAFCQTNHAVRWDGSTLHALPALKSEALHA